MRIPRGIVRERYIISSLTSRIVTVPKVSHSRHNSVSSSEPSRQSELLSQTHAFDIHCPLILHLNPFESHESSFTSRKGLLGDEHHVKK